VSNWLYSSKGNAVAFLHEGLIFSGSGQFLGQLDGVEIWNGRYFGELIQGNRIVSLNHRPLLKRETPKEVGIPEWPADPSTAIEPIMLASGYSDVEISCEMNNFDE